MALSSLKKLGAAIAFASVGRVAAHSSPDLLGNVVDAIFGEEPTPTHSHTTSYVTGTSTTVNDAGETTVVVVVGTTICPVTAAEASESSVLATASSPVPVLTTATSETAAVAVTPSSAPSGSGVGSTSLLQPAVNSTSVAMTTSTIFTTHSSTITACPTAASDCSVGDVTTVVVALSTTICPVTATESASNSTVRPTASGNVPGFGTSRTGALGATTLTRSPSLSTSVSSKTKGSASSSVRVQSTITSSSVVLTTVSASSSSESESSGTVLEMATGSPSDYSAIYTDATEVVSVPSVTATPTDYSGALMSLASSVEASSAEQTGSNGCTGMDCIVVQSNSGVKSKMNASGFALVALAGAVFLL
ncbi:hypothetical protein N8I77_003010 [Diaporthe amygdali]|uniref:Uncharacterized protein n=1 Tax=Phomopsis amygdali TaxID=1214568 RepID=A0AAD9SIC9_PHOAM|nr:hypothetical protein N8I77_003010 [Diaporthe amygdali]